MVKVSGKESGSKILGLRLTNGGEENADFMATLKAEVDVETPEAVGL
jgi:hypothetical protein